jgi:type IV secretion system protein VirD4
MNGKNRKRTKIPFASSIDSWLLNTAVFFSRASLFFASDSKLHKARFARIDELKNLIDTQQGDETSLILGRGAMGNVLRVRPSRRRAELGNTLVVAPTRGGKGLLAVSQLLSWNHSVIVNDIKGDLFTQTAGYRSKLGPVFVIDPRGIGNAFDPLSGAKTEDELYSLATHLLFHPKEGEGAIFTQRAVTMLTQLLLAARQEGYAPLPYVRACIRDGLVAAASRLETINPVLATQFLNVQFSEANLSDRFLLSSWGTLDARLRPLLTETVIRSLSATDFTPSEIILSERPVTVYLRWPERDLLALSPLVRLTWGSLIDGMMDTYDEENGQGCKPVLLLIDEAGRTPIPQISDHAATVVGRRLYLWIAVQDLSQLESEYGHTRAKTLRNNMEHQLYYRPYDLDTARELESRLGRISEYARSKTNREEGKTTEGLSEQAVPLLTAQEIMQLADEDVIGFHRSLPPIKFKRMDWRQYKRLTERQSIPPPKLNTLPEIQNLPQTVWKKEQGRRSYIDPDKIN